MTDAEMQVLLTEALASPQGLCLRVNSVNGFKRLFYRARGEDSEFSVLSLRTSPTAQNQLWIVKKCPEEKPKN